ncbi:MAG: tyrosine-type recombinase/integrase [Spirochaetia bacterium]|nr:tyrosine-type recombinase/integrase [Spirochaetia bacterium]
MRRYSIYKRKNRPNYYAQILNSNTGQYLPPKSTGKTEKSEALLVVADWLKNGLPDGPTRRRIGEAVDVDTILYHVRKAELTTGDAQRIVDALQSRGLIESATMAGYGADSESLFDFLTRLWDYDSSPYVKEKIAYGQSIGRRHCYEQNNRITYWRHFFGESTRLRDLTREGLESFQLYLKTEKGLASNTVNMILKVGTVAFNWAENKEIIASNPATGLRKFSENNKKRGIPTPFEAKKLFFLEWRDERARVANLLAMTTGMRMGEILALRRNDVEQDRLRIKHAWSFQDRLKAPKNGETRAVPLLPAVRTEMLKLADTNPHGDGFIFYSDKPGQPVDGKVFNRALKQALVDMALDPDDRGDQEKRKNAAKEVRERNITFHSWRHYFAANLADKIDLRTVQLATGHKSGVMAEHYASHAHEGHFREISQTVGDVFANVIPFAGSESTG